MAQAFVGKVLERLPLIISANIGNKGVVCPKSNIMST